MAKSIALIQTQTLTSTASSVTFSNIPQNYTDLKLVISSRDSDTSGALTQVSFNGVATSLSSRRIRGTGSAATSTTFASNIYTQGQANGDTANTFGNSEIYIPNYTSSNYKSVSEDGVSENNATAAYMQMTAGLWSSTAAITSITLTSAAGPYLVNSTFTLYGIGGNKATGGTITYGDGYVYHTFTSTGSFLPLEKIKNAEIICVAGGAGGGYDTGGGGGAGGLFYVNGQTFLAGNLYTALIGAGGAGAASSVGTNGGSSVFVSTSSTGGGGGGTSAGAGVSGGSGGGAGGGGSGSSAGSGTSGQGSAGGAVVSTQKGGAGGGGAGGAGQDGQASYYGGIGGIGSSTYTAWHSATSTGVLTNGLYYIAAGGGGGCGGSGTTGGAGGSGGGGRGADPSGSNLATGTANTGSGGGGGAGAGTPRTGAAGGSGLIIVRYPSN